MRATVQVASSAGPAPKINIQVDRTDIRIRHTQMGTRVDLQGAGSYGRLNGPGLPAKLISVALPPGTRIVQVSAAVRATEILVDKPVSPAPVTPTLRVTPDRVLQRRPSVAPNPDLYREDARVACPLARLMGSQKLGDVTVARIAFSPVTLRSDRRLELATQSEVTLQLEAEPSSPARAAEPPVVSSAQQERFRQLARAVVINPEQVLAAPVVRLSPLPTAFAYIILTDNQTWNPSTIKPTGKVSGDLALSWGRLRDWRAQGGLKSRVVTVGDIVNKSFGDFVTGSRDLQHTIRRFLAWAQANWGIAYVLIGGSQQIVPARSVAVSWLTTSAPSDFYYANLGTQDDWTEGQGIHYADYDYTPHLSVGRVAASSAAQADVFVGKIIDYEKLQTQDGKAIPQGYLRRLLVCATSWNRELRVDINAGASTPPGENTYYHPPSSTYAVIKLYETLDILRDSPPVVHQNPATNHYTHFPGDVYSKIHLLETATYKEVQDLAAVFPDGSAHMLTYRKDAGPTVPGWYFDLDTTNFILVFGSANELEPAKYVVHLKPAFREPQNLLRVDANSDIHLLPYAHNAQVTGLGWYFAKSGTDLSPSALQSDGLPTPTPWVVVYDQAANFSSANLQRFVFDPTEEEGSMADQEVLRKQIAVELPQWDDVYRLYEDQFDLPPADRSEPQMLQYNPIRFSAWANLGQHAISLSGHGWMTDCCNGIDNSLADALTNGPCGGIVYADSCLTSRFTDDALCTHFVLNPKGGGVAYVGYTDESEMGLSKFFQQQFFRTLSHSDCLGIALDARTQLLQPGYWDFDPNADGPRRMIIISSLAGDPAMRMTLFGEFAVRTANGRYLSATGGGDRPHDAVRSDAPTCGPWETFNLVPVGSSRYALRTVDGLYLTIDGGGGKATDAVHSDQTGIGVHEAFGVIPQGAKLVTLGTPNGQFITAVNGGGKTSDALRTDATTVGPNELFSLEPRHGVGLAVFLKTARGNYLTAMDGGGHNSDSVHTNAVSAGPWERFTFVPLGRGEYAIRTNNGHYLNAVDGGGRTSDVMHSDAGVIGPWERFTVVPTDLGQIALQTSDGHYLTFMDGGGRTDDVVHSNATAIGPWEKLSVTATYAFQTDNGRYLTAENGGGMTQNALHSNATEISVFERFTLIPLGSQCALQTPDGHYLNVVDGGGRTTDVMHSDAGAIGPWEHFTIIPRGGKKVALQTISGNYVTAVDGGGRNTDVVHTNATAVGPWEEFTLVPQGSGVYALQTVNGHYLTVVGGGGRTADVIHSDTTAIGPYEKLLLVPMAGEQYGIRTSNGRFVTAVDGGGRTTDVVHTDAKLMGPWERFTLVPIGVGQFALQTMDGHYLTVVDGGGRTADVVHTDATAIGPWETLVLVGC